MVKEAVCAAYYAVEHSPGEKRLLYDWPNNVVFGSNWPGLDLNSFGICAYWLSDHLGENGKRLCRPCPTKPTEALFGWSMCVWPRFVTLHRLWSTTSALQSCRSTPTFHRRSPACPKKTLACFWRGCRQMVTRACLLKSDNSCGTHFSSFSLYPSLWMWRQMVVGSKFSCSAMSKALRDGWFSNNSTSCGSSTSTGRPDRSLSSMLSSLSLKRLNQSQTVVFDTVLSPNVLLMVSTVLAPLWPWRQWYQIMVRIFNLETILPVGPPSTRSCKKKVNKHTAIPSVFARNYFFFYGNICSYHFLTIRSGLQMKFDEMNCVSKCFYDWIYSI